MPHLGHLAAAYVVLVAACCVEASAPFRPPMTPLVTFAPMHQLFVLGNITDQPLSPIDASDRQGRYWSGVPMGLNAMVRFQNASLSNSPNGGASPAVAVYQLLGSDWLTGGIPFAELDGYPQVDPLVTHVRFRIPSVPGISPSTPVRVTLRFVHLKLPDRLDLMAWPLVYLEAEVQCPGCVDGGGLTASVYVDMNAYNAMHIMGDEEMTWSAESMATPTGVCHVAKFGTAKQPILSTFGDDFMMDWGYLYLATMEDATDGSIVSSATGGNATVNREAFASGADTLPGVDPTFPRLAADGAPLIAVMTTFPISPPSITAGADGPPPPIRFVIGYNEDGMQFYFGDVMYGAWATAMSSFEELVVVALQRYTAIRALVASFDATLMADMANRVSSHYAIIGALAFRQTFAAIELTHSKQYNEDWAFLKEISSDGDINTMDVIFPASPVLLYMCPSVVKMLLLPVLHYAVNDTWHPYTYPFSPHQLGTYPVANITTSEQEVMPAENTGNMFLLLLAYMQRTNFTDLDWIYLDYWPVLTDWAMFMVETQLPVPPHQICTDDFAGPLAQNTNLAAKCIVALEAFAEMCTHFEAIYAHNATAPQPKDGWHCSVFHELAVSYADFWAAFAVETDPLLHLNHSRLAFDQPNTWSTKYNLLWQKLLGLQYPFATFDTLAADEVAYYRAKSNAYGFPMDIRHSYQKLDWMTWGACLSNNVTEFAELFEGIYRMANDTTSRWPLTDLFDTVTADIVLGFKSRPVVGAVFAAMMLYP